MTETKKIRAYRSLAETYFASCDEANKSGMQKPYTMPGLLFALGLTKEQFRALSDGREGRAFCNEVRLKIEAFIEENALSGKITSNAAMNSLKYNFGWNDRAADAETGSVVVTLDADARSLAQ